MICLSRGCFYIFIFLYLFGCYNTSATFCQNLSEEYKKLLEQDETIEVHSWESLYTHHEFLAEALLEKWKTNSVEKKQFFSLTFYAFLRSRVALECGVEPETKVIVSEQKISADSAGLTKIRTKNHPYFKCLFSKWKEQAKPLIFKSCKYYFTH